jgi:hypothetical protein
MIVIFEAAIIITSGMRICHTASQFKLKDRSPRKSVSRKAIQDLRMNHDAVRLTLYVLERIAQKIERNDSLDNPKHVEHPLFSMMLRP